MRNRTHLRKWQAAAAEKAACGSLVLAAQPGSGKTIVLLTAAADAISAKRINRILLVAPRIILDTVFPAESASWEHTKHLRFVMAHNYTNRDRAHAHFKIPGEIVTCTPDTLASVVHEISGQGKIPFDAIFADEAQGFKNSESVRTKGMLALSEVVPHIVLSSGTPTPNGPIDAWSPGRLVAPGDAFWNAKFHKWRASHFSQVSTYGWRPKKGAEDTITKKLGEIGVSIRLDQTSDIPPALYLNQPFEHPPEHKATIRSFMENGEVKIGHEMFGESGTEGGFLIRLQELTNGFRYRVDGTTEMLSISRVEALQEIVESADGPVLVAVGFKADVTMIKRAFPKAVVYAGNTPIAERSDIIKRWNADQIPVLLGNPGAMGVGINLQLGSAKTIIWYTAPFSWEKFAQMNARLIRTGQKRSVSVVRLQSDVGIDHAVASVIDRKKAGEAALIDALNITNSRSGVSGS
jgi:hypothetical protein